jgi:hypothetical protein
MVASYLLTKLMGIPPSELKDKHWARISTQDRLPLGKVAVTSAEAEQKRQVTEERELHRQFEQWLNLREIYYIHSRMDRASTIAKGAWDFTLLKNGHGLAIEFKIAPNKLTVEQEICGMRLTVAKVPHRVCYDLSSAIKFAEIELRLNVDGN